MFFGEGEGPFQGYVAARTLRRLHGKGTHGIGQRPAAFQTPSGDNAVEESCTGRVARAGTIDDGDLVGAKGMGARSIRDEQTVGAHFEQDLIHAIAKEKLKDAFGIFRARVVGGFTHAGANDVGMGEGSFHQWEPGIGSIKAGVDGSLHAQRSNPLEDPTYGGTVKHWGQAGATPMKDFGFAHQIEIDVVFRNDAHRTHIMKESSLTVATDKYDRRGGIVTVDASDTFRIDLGVLKGSNEKIPEGIVAKTSRIGRLATQLTEHRGGDAGESAHGHIERGHQAQCTPFWQGVYRLCFYISAHATYSN